MLTLDLRRLFHLLSCSFCFSQQITNFQKLGFCDIINSFLLLVKYTYCASIPSRKLFQSTLIEKIQGCVGTFFSFVFYVSHPELNRIGAANYFLFIGKIFFFLKETNTNEFYKIPYISHLSLWNHKERQQLTMWIWSLCPSEDGLDKHKHEHKNIKIQCSS